MPDTPGGGFVRRSSGYPGRNALDAASSRFRRASARLYREGIGDPATAAKLEPIITEAVQALEDLATRAEKAADNSARNRAMLAKEEAKLDRLLRKAARQGHPAAVRLAEKFAQHRAAQDGPSGDDAA